MSDNTHISWAEDRLETGVKYDQLGRPRKYISGHNLHPP